LIRRSEQASLAAPQLERKIVTMPFDIEFCSPAENLACDEALLDFCENGSAGGLMRFWESPAHFVVLGYAKQIDQEVFRRACEELGIPIFRRCSGGGTVLQGPGCLNYTLVLPIDAAPELGTITGANRFIMERNRAVLAELAGRSVEVRGCTDLAIEGRKFSGNAQRRKRRALLFHGSFLIDFEIELICRTLRAPAQQPEYREQRTHADFVTNVRLDRAELQSSFTRAWNGIPELDGNWREQVASLTRELVRTKYSLSSWNERF